MVKFFPHDTIKGHVAVFIGNICNLACALCGPNASTLWQYELGIKENHQPIIEDFDFSNYNSVLFTGGEPLLNQSFMKILQKLDNDTQVVIHSNGTLLPSQEQIDQFTKFKNISIIFSIDDIEEQFEFLRYPASWQQVKNNILYLKDSLPKNINIGFLTVVSILNESTHLRVSEWVRQNFPSNVVWNTQEANGLFNRKTYTECVAECVEFLDALDKRRKTNWRNIFPVAVKLLDLN